MTGSDDDAVVFDEERAAAYENRLGITESKG